MFKLSIEMQKGIITIQQFSVENQAGTIIAVQSLWQQCPSGSNRNSE